MFVLKLSGIQIVSFYLEFLIIIFIDHYYPLVLQ